MARFPFQLLIKSASSDEQAQSVFCTALLRAVPGRREVYDAVWNGRPVIAKVFSHKIIAKRHIKREWRGLSLLQGRGLNSPEPLFYGRTNDGQWAVVVEKIGNSETALDVLHKTEEKSRRLDFLVPICRELAKLHDNGIIQQDLHLGNFLLRDGKAFVLDPGSMRFFSQPLTKKRSISQLALLLHGLTQKEADIIAELCKVYSEARNWNFDQTDKQLFHKQLTMHKKKGVKRGLAKCLRTSKRYLRIKADGYVAVFDRGFCRGTERLDFVRQLDALMDKGQILKDGDTSYVSRLTWKGKDVVVKRYNHKGFIHSLRHTIKRSRARRGWLHGHRLKTLKIATPKPSAYIEQYKGKLIWQSYLVTEYVKGQNFYYFLRDNKINDQRRSNAIQQVKKVLDKLGKYRITHGDLKHTSILITENGPVLTDLDGMKVHRWNWLYKIRRDKDRARITKTGRPIGEKMRIRVDRQFRIARLWSNREIKRLAPLFAGDVVNVSAWDDRDKEGGYYKEYFPGAYRYYYTNYTGIRGYQQKENEYLVDLTGDLPGELKMRFDVVFNHTTLEHIFDIRKAFENFCNMTKDVAIVVVPFSQVQHETESYKDYWRFTPSCMRQMFLENGLDVIYEAESKYKEAAIYLLFVASRNPRKWKEKMPKFEPIIEAGRSIGFRWSFKELKQKFLQRRQRMTNG